jgi:hypothetical protein
MADFALKILREEVLGEQLTGESVRYFINEFGKQTRHLILSNTELETAILDYGPDEDFQDAIVENQESILRRKSQMRAYMDALCLLDPVYSAAHSEELDAIRDEFNLASADVPQWTGPQCTDKDKDKDKGRSGAEVCVGDEGPGAGAGAATHARDVLPSPAGLEVGHLCGPGSVLEIVLGRRRQPELEARYLLGANTGPDMGTDRAPTVTAAAAAAAGSPGDNGREQDRDAKAGQKLLESDAAGGLFL